MGALSRGLWTVVLLALGLTASPGRAQAPATRLWLAALDGPPRPGDVVTLELAAATGGALLDTGEVPRVEMVDAEPLGAPEALGGGRWRARFRVDPQVRAGAELGVRISLAGVSQELPVSVVAPARPSLMLPELVEATAGRDSVLVLPVRSADPPPPADLQVVVDEGTVGEVLAVAGGLDVRWTASEDPMPRVVPWAARDARYPRRPPSWGVVNLVGRPRIPIETDPGASVKVDVGGRSYGPFVAGADGVAVATVEVRAGETLAEVVASDALGNQQRTRIALGGAAAPRLLMLTEGALVPGQPPPELHVLAVRGDGRPWTGSPPDCRTRVGAPLQLALTGPGLWHAVLPPGVEALFDLRVECSLEGQARALLQVPVETGVPAAVRLRVWPTELDADLPVAQVQAWLEGPQGDRLPSEGIQLSAARGSLVSEPGSQATVVAAYDGSNAISAGADVLEARWQPPVGQGGAWRLSAGLAGATGVDGLLPVRVQALDRLGRPLPGVRLRVSAGEAAGTDEVEALTGEGGLAQVAVPVAAREGPWVLAVRTEAIEHRSLAFATDAQDPSRSPAAELIGRVELRLNSGEVRRIAVSAQPDRLEAGGTDRARVVVRLQDQAGHPVTDEAPELRASQGRIGRVRLNDDGSWEAEYTPPEGLTYGEVRIEVAGPDGRWSAETRVEVLPRRLRRAVGPAGGYMLGGGLSGGPFGGVELDVDIPLLPAAFLGRVSVSAFGQRKQVLDEQTGETVTLESTWFPVAVGLLGRQERGRLAFFGGLEVSLVPFRQVSTYGDRIATRQPGLVAPGLEPLVGVGYRLWGTEIQAQLAYLWLTMPPGDVGFEGLVGGFQPSLSWKVLF